jgi:hypothetical protein
MTDEDIAKHAPMAVAYGHALIGAMLHEVVMDSPDREGAVRSMTGDLISTEAGIALLSLVTVALESDPDAKLPTTEAISGRFRENMKVMREAAIEQRRMAQQVADLIDNMPADGQQELPN